jgi:hypothetical protein
MKPDTFCWFHIEPRQQKKNWTLDPPLVARNDIKFWTLDPSLVARNDNGPWALESSEKREISTRSIPVPATCSFLQTHWPTTTRRRCQRCSPVPKATGELSVRLPVAAPWTFVLAPPVVAVIRQHRSSDPARFARCRQI